MTKAKEATAMTVRAKFAVTEITTRAHWDRSKGHLGVVKLQPVSDGSEENKRFYEATPCGSIELGTLNKDALAQFAIGQQFYVDFTPAE
jgi:hypothetical protein